MSRWRTRRLELLAFFEMSVDFQNDKKSKIGFLVTFLYNFNANRGGDLPKGPKVDFGLENPMSFPKIAKSSSLQSSPAAHRK